MNIRHENLNIDGNNKIYIYVEIEDEYEFGEEFLSSEKIKNFYDKLKSYVINKINIDKDDTAVLVINGVLVGAISLAVFFNATEDKIKENTQYANKVNYEVAFDYVNDEQKQKAKELEAKKNDINLEANKIVAEDTTTPKVEENKVTTDNTVKSNTSVATTTNKTTTNNVATSNTVAAPVAVQTPTTSTGTTIKLNTNGNVAVMNIEDYVVGVVAAEMPASFNLEALKAQAVASRTFAMKKTSEGKTLSNSTADQVYKTEAQCKQMWGSSFTTYYNKIKSAVNATKGLVITYNGKYIDALYHAISNTKTELPKYIWGTSIPYLQSVSSNWDANVKGFQVSTNITYSTLSSKLGKTITKNTEFKILSETVSGRVESIKIGDTTYSGVKLRTLLGLRSTDFTISKNETNVTVTTKGYGHGVGMSQYGANEAAKEGYSYAQILKHYYTGISIVQR